ncbi:hypothetical protein ACHAPU_010335 [Fusarium lateritium]
MPSVHARGLVPFLKENPLLRIERRVSTLSCVADVTPSLRNATGLLRIEHVFEGICNRDLRDRLSSWLLGALAMADLGLSAKSFSLLLESGSHTEYCTELWRLCRLDERFRFLETAVRLVTRSVLLSPGSAAWICRLV